MDKKMTVWMLLLLVQTCQASCEDGNVPDWQSYVKARHKHYTSLLDQMRHLKVYIANSVDYARSLMRFRAGLSSYHLEINQFSDKTPQELQSTLTHKMDSDQSQKRRVKRGANFFGKLFGLKKRRESMIGVDWRNSSCILAPGQADSQSETQCGCCYAIASLAIVEYFRCTQTSSQVVRWSTQFMLDCGHLTGLNGCQNGDAKSTFEFIKNYGLVRADERPFVGQDRREEQSQCLAHHRERLIPTDLQYKIVQRNDWHAKLERSPLIAYLLVPEDFYFYSEGVYENSECYEDNGHFVVLVGSGEEAGEPFWLVQNSFGSEWGQEGYMKLSQKNPCLIYLLEVEARFE